MRCGNYLISTYGVKVALILPVLFPQRVDSSLTIVTFIPLLLELIVECFGMREEILRII